MQRLVNITLHGKLGKHVGKTWNLAVTSVGEAMRAIEQNSKKKLYKFLADNDKLGVKYRVLINKRDFLCETTPNLEDPKSIVNSELVCEIMDLETIDIIPIIEGTDDGGIFSTILGAILIVVGIIVAMVPGFAPLGVGIVTVGIGLLAAGIVAMLSKPPKFEDFREIDGSTGRTSYLFNGPENTTREGGPVPVGYGNLIVGSQVISAAYKIKTTPASESFSYQGISSEYASIYNIIAPINFPTYSSEKTQALFDLVGHQLLIAKKDFTATRPASEPLKLGVVESQLSTILYDLSTKTSSTKLIYENKAIQITSALLATQGTSYIQHISHFNGQNYTILNSLSVNGGQINYVSSPKYYTNRCYTIALPSTSQNGTRTVPFSNPIQNTIAVAFYQNAPQTPQTTPSVVTNINKTKQNTDGSIFFCGNFANLSVSGKTAKHIAKLPSPPNTVSPDIDNTFNSSGNSDINGEVIDFEFDNTLPTVPKIYVATGSKVIRLFATTTPSGTSGSTDTSFTTLTVLGGTIKTLHFDSTTNKLYVGGTFTSVNQGSNQNIPKLCVLESGVLNTGLSITTSTATDDGIYTIYCQRGDGKVIIGGQFSNINGSTKYCLARLLSADWSLDSLFVTSQFQGLIEQVEVIESSSAGAFTGKIIVAGSFNFYPSSPVLTPVNKDFVILDNPNYIVA